MTKGKTSILVTPKGKEITLADGKVYHLSEINLNILADLEEELEYTSRQELIDKFETQGAKSIRVLLHILLKKNHPNLTKEDVGELVTLEIMGDIQSVILDLFGAVQAIGE